MPFQKGQSGNPAGRKKGHSSIRDKFNQALKSVEKQQGKTFLKHLCELAYSDPKVAVALAKKILPDLTESDIKSNQPIIVQIIDDFK